MSAHFTHLTCRGHISYLQSAKMKRSYIVSQVLDTIFGETDEDADQHSDAEEQASGEEDDVEYQPEDTDTSESDEVTGAEAAAPEGFKSKNGRILWSSVAQHAHVRAAAENAVKMAPGITRFAVTRVGDIKTCFELFLPFSIKKSHHCYDKPGGEKKSMATCGKTLMRNALTLSLVFFSLECKDPAMRPLIVSGTHRQAEIFSGQQCHFTPFR